MWGSVSLGLAQSSLAAEAKVLIGAMQSVWSAGFRNVIFQGDSEILVKSINGQAQDITIHNFLVDISTWCLKLVSPPFTFVKRTGNQAPYFGL